MPDIATVPIPQRRFKIALKPPSGIFSIDYDQTADEVAEVLERYGHLVKIGAIAISEALEIKRTN